MKQTISISRIVSAVAILCSLVVVLNSCQRGHGCPGRITDSEATFSLPSYEFCYTKIEIEKDEI
jgi:hypothetical protein